MLPTSRFCFLDPCATTFFVDWDKTADDSVAVLTNLIGERSTQSQDFCVRWARHDVGSRDTPQADPSSTRWIAQLTYEGMTLAADADLVLFAFTAEVGSKSEEALNLLTLLARRSADHQFRTGTNRLGRLPAVGPVS